MTNSTPPNSVTPKKAVASGYVQHCLDPIELATYYGLRDAYSVQKFAQEEYGPTFEVQRKANYLRLLRDNFGYSYYRYTAPLDDYAN